MKEANINSTAKYGAEVVFSYIEYCTESCKEYK